MATDPSSASHWRDGQLVGGPEKRPVVIVAPDPRWPLRFGAERRRIADALGPVAARIDHIGSTAVPDLAAKPIVDIQVSVVDVEDEDAYRPDLEAAGYELARRDSPTVNHYAQAKTEVIADIMERAEVWAGSADWHVEESP